MRAFRTRNEMMDFIEEQALLMFLILTAFVWMPIRAVLRMIKQ